MCHRCFVEQPRLAVRTSYGCATVVTCLFASPFFARPRSRTFLRTKPSRLLIAVVSTDHVDEILKKIDFVAV